MNIFLNEQKMKEQKCYARLMKRMINCAVAFECSELVSEITKLVKRYIHSQK